MKPLSRRLFLSGLGTGVATGLAACGQEKIERIEPPATPSATASSGSPAGSNPRKWSHYGDSLTASGFLAQGLEALTGYQHISAGVAGDTSLAGAFRAGAVTLEVELEEGIISASDPTTVTALSLEPNPIAANYWHYPCEIAGVSGYLMRDYGALETYFHRDSPGEAVPAPGLTPVQLDPGKPTDILTEGIRDKYSLILGFGRNDIDTGLAPDETVANIRSILNTNTDEGARQLIWDVPPWALEPKGSDARSKVEQLNGVLEQEFGDIFVTPVRWILENPREAFSAARISMTDQDRSDIEDGIIPKSLRVDDLGHFNEAGAQAWAHYMFQEIKKRGW